MGKMKEASSFSPVGARTLARVTDRAECLRPAVEGAVKPFPDFARCVPARHTSSAAEPSESSLPGTW